MNRSGIQLLVIFLATSLLRVDAFAFAPQKDPLSGRIDRLVASMTVQSALTPTSHRKTPTVMIVGPGIRIENCANYPYHQQQTAVQGYTALAKDIREGLRIGIQAMAGHGPMGALHPYHRRQAIQLLDLLEDGQQKTFRCVEDKTFAYAVSKPPPKLFRQYQIAEVIRDIPYPGVAIDTYRLSGFLTRTHAPSTYRDFFKLNEQQIAEHLAGNPQRIEPLHRYQNLKALAFHEMVHWLGHAHTNLHPDVVDLYETCFFGGSDFIADQDSNRKFQLRACDILKDNELWDASKKQQARLWRTKGYDQLKLEMRTMYD